MTFQPTTPVWRYMSLAKFVWMLQNKQLWLANVKILDDKWEMMPDDSLIDFLRDKMPENFSVDELMMRLAYLVEAWRDETYVSCWNASEHESHALWRIYCPTSEGVAVQTTLDCLQKSVAPLPVSEVSYAPVKDDGQNALRSDLMSSRKRPMFAYEQEVRVVLSKDFSDTMKPNHMTIGCAIPWNPEEHIQRIWLHPESQSWFYESVKELVRILAPSLSDKVSLSKMHISPPF